MRSASSAGTRRAVRIMSRARPRPTRRGRRTVPPPPGMIPIRVSVSPICAAGSTTRRSQARASSQPPPSARPFTAAIQGFGHRSTSRRAVWSSTSHRRTSSSVQLRRSLRFAPAQKARVPFPVRTTARTPASAAARFASAESSATSARESTFIRASPSISTTRTGGRSLTESSAMIRSSPPAALHRRRGARGPPADGVRAASVQ